MSGNRRQKHKEVHLSKANDDKIINLPDEFVTIINKVPAKQRKEVTESLVAIFSQYSYSGPIPPPEMLKQYDDIYPGLSKEIIDNSFSQTKHRHELEKTALPYEIKRMERGQIFGFIIAIIGIGAAVFLAYLGHDTVGGILGGSTVLGLVTVFVLGKRAKPKKRQ